MPRFCSRASRILVYPGRGSISRIFAGVGRAIRARLGKALQFCRNCADFALATALIVSICHLVFLRNVPVAFCINSPLFLPDAYIVPYFSLIKKNNFSRKIFCSRGNMSMEDWKGLGSRRCGWICGFSGILTENRRNFCYNTVTQAFVLWSAQEKPGKFLRTGRQRGECVFGRIFFRVSYRAFPGPLLIRGRRWRPLLLPCTNGDMGAEKGKRK